MILAPTNDWSARVSLHPRGQCPALTRVTTTQSQLFNNTLGLGCFLPICLLLVAAVLCCYQMKPPPPSQFTSISGVTLGPHHKSNKTSALAPN